MKVMSVVGARPQFVKAAPLARALARRDRVEHVILHTGQHFDRQMSAVFFEDLEIPEPEYSLDIHGGGHGEMTGRMLIDIERVLIEACPDVVVVYGDTNSTLAGALASAKLHLPVAHVEAGLRSFNRLMPEEINRVVADHLASLLLCPTHVAVRNLRAEGVNDAILHVGDLMFDATVHAAKRAAAKATIVRQLGLQGRPYAVATVHRAENTDTREALARVLTYLRNAASDQPVVLPLHPRTREAAEAYGLEFGGLLVCDPLSYLDMAQLVSSATVVLTDSGGLQKEAYFHAVPCVTLRSETEWTETIEAGWNRLWSQPEYTGARRTIDDYGAGDAATRIADALEQHFRPAASA